MFFYVRTNECLKNHQLIVKYSTAAFVEEEFSFNSFLMIALLYNVLPGYSTCYVHKPIYPVIEGICRKCMLSFYSIASCCKDRGSLRN